MEGEGLLLLIPFFLLYLLIVTANSILTYTVGVEEDLHSPTHSPIALLLTVSPCSSSTFVPKMLLGFLFHLSHISLRGGCVAQIFFPYFFIALDCNTLLRMDRNVAICNPLHYTDIMTRKYPSRLPLAAIARKPFVSPVVILASKVHLCHSNVVKHFLCEQTALVSLSRGDTSRNNVELATRAITVVFDLGFLLTSYCRIIHTALKIASGKAQHKACCTSATHLVAVLVTDLPSSTVYQMGKSVSEDVHNLISVTYLLLLCGINPIICGVRTKEIREHLLKLLKKEVWCRSPLRQQPQASGATTSLQTHNILHITMEMEL
ncbi:LOW QUALITY PROTEIN: olfactory receptor 52K1-like [Morus bassanus]